MCQQLNRSRLSFSTASTVLHGQTQSTFPFLVIFFVLPLIFSPNGGYVRFAEGGKRRVHITDDLDDVVDDEEDETWKEWGKKSTPSKDFNPPPNDLSKMDLSEIQTEMIKRHSGPAFGFVKLRYGVKRTRGSQLGRLRIDDQGSPSKRTATDDLLPTSTSSCVVTITKHQDQ